MSLCVCGVVCVVCVCVLYACCVCCLCASVCGMVCVYGVCPCVCMVCVPVVCVCVSMYMCFQANIRDAVFQELISCVPHIRCSVLHLLYDGSHSLS